MTPRTLWRRFLRWRTRQRNATRSTEEIFSDIYSRNSWGGAPGEFFSGAGSRGAHSERYIELVRRFIAANDVKTVVDIGCGDFAIGREIAKACERYVGIDIVPSLIAHHNSSYATDGVAFQCLDAARDPLPAADLCLIRQVLQHLSNESIQAIVDKFGAYRFVIVTEHYPPKSRIKGYNIDKVTGPDIRDHDGSAVFLDKPPFNLAIEMLQSTPLPQAGKPPRSDDDLPTLATFLVRR
jgi:SAM-dependent methyltransferase